MRGQANPNNEPYTNMVPAPLKQAGRPPTTSSILRFINSLPRDTLFFTRDCLRFGIRSAVDQCLSRLVKEEFIVRIARGCFMKFRYGQRLPSAAVIAYAKAAAFNKQLFVHGKNALHILAANPDHPFPTTFATAGATSSFWSLQGRIFVQRRAPRKLVLGESAHALLIRGLWDYRSEALASHLKLFWKDKLGRSGWTDLEESTRFMPDWLARILVFRQKVSAELTTKLKEFVDTLIPPSERRRYEESIAPLEMQQRTIRAEDPSVIVPSPRGACSLSDTCGLSLKCTITEECMAL